MFGLFKLHGLVPYIVTFQVYKLYSKLLFLATIYFYRWDQLPSWPSVDL